MSQELKDTMKLIIIIGAMQKKKETKVDQGYSFNHFNLELLPGAGLKWKFSFQNERRHSQ
jgi:hypothetical protein